MIYIYIYTHNFVLYEYPTGWCPRYKLVYKHHRISSMKFFGNASRELERGPHRRPTWTLVSSWVLKSWTMSGGPSAEARETNCRGEILGENDGTWWIWPRNLWWNHGMTFVPGKINVKKWGNSHLIYLCPRVAKMTQSTLRRLGVSTWEHDF